MQSQSEALFERRPQIGLFRGLHFKIGYRAGILIQLLTDTTNSFITSLNYLLDS